MSDWRPSASQERLAARAALTQQIRHFFHTRDVMEVETPLLCQGTVPDPGIEIFSVPMQDADSPDRYLQTSPEFAMKALVGVRFRGHLSDRQGFPPGRTRAPSQPRVHSARVVSPGLGSRGVDE